MDDRAKGSPRCRCKSRERAAASTRFVQQRAMPHCHKLLISNQLRNERRFRTRSQRGSIVHARLSLRAASRGPRATIGSVASRCRAEDRRRLVFDMLAAPSRRADESFKTERMTRLVITAKHRADGVRETLSRALQAMVPKARTVACLPPKIFFQNLSSLPKNLAGHFGDRNKLDFQTSCKRGSRLLEESRRRKKLACCLGLKSPAAARTGLGSGRHCRSGSAGRPRRRAAGSYAGPFPATVRRPAR